MKRLPQRFVALSTTCALLAAAVVGAMAAAAERVALVVGNAAYAHSGPLANPGSDARATAAKLRGPGFDVVMATDIDHEGLFDRIAVFHGKARDVDVSPFYYAGRGLQCFDEAGDACASPLQHGDLGGARSGGVVGAWRAGTRLVIPARIVREWQEALDSWTYVYTFFFANYSIPGQALLLPRSYTFYIPLVGALCGERREVLVDMLLVTRSGAREDSREFVVSEDVLVLAHPEDYDPSFSVGGTETPLFALPCARLATLGRARRSERIGPRSSCGTSICPLGAPSAAATVE